MPPAYESHAQLCSNTHTRHCLLRLDADERHVLLQAVRVLNIFNQSLLDVHQVVTEEFKVADAVDESLGEDVSSLVIRVALVWSDEAALVHLTA